MGDGAEAQIEARRLDMVDSDRRTANRER